ncbi:hypothetical protein D3C85_1097520 [compost metagenome]
MVVLVTRLSLGDCDLVQDRRLQLHDLELGDVAFNFFQALDSPWRRNDRLDHRGWHAVFVLQHFDAVWAVEEAERRFEDRRTVAVLVDDGVDREFFHQHLQALGQRRLTTTDWTQEVQDLLAFFQALSSVAVVSNDLLDRVFHAMELGEGRVALDFAVLEDAAQTSVITGVDHFRFADCRQHTLGRSCVGGRSGFAQFQVFVERNYFWLLAFVLSGEFCKGAHRYSFSSFMRVNDSTTILHVSD